MKSRLFLIAPCVVASCLVLLAGRASGQAVASATAAVAPVFDAVSIKPNKTGSGHEHLHTSSENADLKTENTTLKTLLEFAYNVKPMQVVGVPADVDAAHFDVEAKADNSVNEHAAAMNERGLDALTKGMARKMLEDRFGLVVHRETRQLPVFALVVAKGGAKLKDSDVQGTHVTGRHGSLVTTGISAADLAAELADNVGRVVVDKTGLQGRYELTLRWLPEDGRPPLVNGEPDASVPSIFTAVQEQLGLKLEAGKGPVEVLVVDRVSMPTEN